MAKIALLTLLLLLAAVDVFSFVTKYKSESLIHVRMSASSDSNVATGPNIEVISQPDKEFLEKKGVFSWGTWGCGASKFPWTYDSSESCYLLEGKVTVTPTDNRPACTFGKGDFVTFPAGMSCTWDVSEPVKKHYMFF